MVTLTLTLINLLFTAYSLAIVARALLPWFRVSRYHPVMRFVVQITEPVLAPLRRFIPSAGGLDFSPMVALVILWVVQSLLRSLVVALF